MFFVCCFCLCVLFVVVFFGFYFVGVFCLLFFVFYFVVFSPREAEMNHPRLEATARGVRFFVFLLLFFLKHGRLVFVLRPGNCFSF